MLFCNKKPTTEWFSKTPVPLSFSGLGIMVCLFPGIYDPRLGLYLCPCCVNLRAMPGLDPNLTRPFDPDRSTVYRRFTYDLR